MTQASSTKKSVNWNAHIANRQTQGLKRNLKVHVKTDLTADDLLPVGCSTQGTRSSQDNTLSLGTLGCRMTRNRTLTSAY